jgi:uncharacterized protein YndB with AHSA1/START domain
VFAATIGLQYPIRGALAIPVQPTLEVFAMRTAMRILIGLVLALIAFSALVSIQPAAFKITRTATISAPPEKVFAAVNDFHKWQAWSPWLGLDPAAKSTFEGPAAGTGAKFAWVGNDKVGEGRMEIQDSKPGDHVLIKLDFVKPMQGTSDTEFTFKPVSGGTEVTWTMTGEDGFVGKAARYFMNIDKMVGGDFERGLGNLKTVAEGK